MPRRRGIPVSLSAVQLHLDDDHHSGFHLETENHESHNTVLASESTHADDMYRQSYYSSNVDLVELNDIHSLDPDMLANKKKSAVISRSVNDNDAEYKQQKQAMARIMKHLSDSNLVELEQLETKSSLERLKRFFEEIDEIEYEKTCNKFVLCRHQLSCLENVLSGAINGFVSGVAMLVTLSLIGNIVKGKLNINNLINSYTVRFGLCLGSLTGVYKLIFCYLRRICNSNNGVVVAVAGAIAGFCGIRFIRGRDQRLALACWLLVRVLHLFYDSLVLNGKIKAIPFASAISFGIAQIPIMYGYVHAPHLMDQSYLRLVGSWSGMTSEHIRQVFRPDIPNSFPPCIPIFHEQPCVRNSVTNLVTKLKGFLKMYSVVHGMILLLFKRGSVMKHPGAQLIGYVRNVFGSALFLSFYTTSVMGSACFWRNTFQRDDCWHVSFGGALSMIPMILFESQKRHLELALYVIPKSLFVCIKWLYVKNYLRRITAFDQDLLFAASFGLLMYYYEKEKKVLRRMYLPPLNWLIGTT